MSEQARKEVIQKIVELKEGVGDKMAALIHEVRRFRDSNWDRDLRLQLRARRKARTR
jgi:hypothetical protein